MLITGYHDGNYSIYEPFNGLTHDVPRADLLNQDTSKAAYGNWSTAQAVFLP
ncbi:MAG: hypothetical protein LBI99_08840 [Propionibacteriaceae bacterium]|jgi:hypothetical protein|nr:hypothetical protein [Propionibacteriaceae bacterium]